ncbi:MAG: hypothetical protein AAFX58_09945 [Pseudomonadota bacterium]
MLPNAEQSLYSLAGYMGKEMVPRIDDGYTANMTALISGLLLMIAHDYEHAADNFVAENDGIRALFERYIGRIDDAALKTRLAGLATAGEPGYRVSHLRDENHSLRKLLIEFHAAIEDIDADWAREADAAVWQLLAATREREKIEHVLDLFNSPG